MSKSKDKYIAELNHEIYLLNEQIALLEERLKSAKAQQAIAEQNMNKWKREYFDMFRELTRRHVNE